MASPAGHIELRHLRYFVAVAEELHFARAAEKLGIAQPGLSQQIKALERSLGVELFIRDKRGVALTEAGETLLEHARQILQLTDRAVQNARMVGLAGTGVLRVGISAVAALPGAKHVLQEFQDRYPRVEVEIHPGVGPQSIEGLTRRTLDAAIVFAPFEAREGIEYLNLDTIELMVAVPKGHRLASMDHVPPSELLAEPLLEGPRSANPVLTDHIHRSLFGEVAHPRLVVSADVLETSRLQLVADGRGVALSFPPSLGGLQIRGVEFRPFVPPAPSLDSGLIWYESDPSRLVKAFVAVARDVAGARATSGAA